MRFVTGICIGALAIVAYHGTPRGQESIKYPARTRLIKSQDQTSRSKESSVRKEKFPWDRRDILVFYALDSEDRDPRPGTPSLVMKDFLELDKDNQVFLTDGAPYISVTTMEDLRETIAKRKAKGNLSKEIVKRLDQILDWMKKSGKPIVGFQAEPAEMAGDGTARAKGLKAEKELE